MKVFITGGAGFIGSYLAKRLLAAGHEPVLYDAFKNFVSPADVAYDRMLRERMAGLEKVPLEKGDTRSYRTMRRAVDRHRPDAFVHLAALPNAKESWTNSEDALAINVDGTLNALELLKDCPSIRKFVFASSSFVYGHFQRTPCDEEHPLDPIDVYGASKIAGEVLVKAYGRQAGVPWTIIRPSSVYGFGDVNRRVSQLIIENAVRGRPIRLHDGGRPTIDFTHVTDTAEGFFLAATKPEANDQVFNVTRGEARSIGEYAELVRKTFPKATIVYEPEDTARPRRGTLSIEKARRLLGYAPKVSLEKGVEEYVRLVVEKKVYA